MLLPMLFSLGNTSPINTCAALVASDRCQTAWKNGQGIRENSVENCPP